MAFGQDWRQRRIVHKTPGGKLTRVKISSLPAEEQQRYNPNRYKNIGDAGGSSSMITNDIDAGHIFDFYIEMRDEKEIYGLEDNELILATNNGLIVPTLFTDDNSVIMKLKNVPMNAVIGVALPLENGDDLDAHNVDSADFEDISELEGKARYEKIKFSETEIFKINVIPYLEYMDIKVDDGNSDENVTESFYNYYFE